MATRSPTAKLLRYSRLFSLPSPLPSPIHNTASVVFASNTATLPYPTHASIETAQSSLVRGDWGLKRPLPLQSTTATTTPVIRIEAVDSIDHVTDFDSAADHSLTLKKWQEMSIQISVLDSKDSYARTQSGSVFEEDLNRIKTNTQGRPNSSFGKQWKHKGPWLAGKTKGGFEDYLSKVIKHRRVEFRRFLREKLHEKLIASSRNTAMDDGVVLSSIPDELSKEKFRAEVGKLRHNITQLFQWIWQFLDLPGFPPQHQSHLYELSGSDIEQDPPSTHLSAGVSYLQTASHIYNHPVLGPMSSRPPVLGRIMQYAAPTNINKKNRVLIGVGGVVAEEARNRDFHDSKSPQWSNFDPDLEGGPKGWVQIRRASIDPHGRINLEVDKADGISVAVWQKQNEDDIYGYNELARSEKPTRHLESYRQRPQYEKQESSEQRPPAKEYLSQEETDLRTKLEVDRLLQEIP